MATADGLPHRRNSEQVPQPQISGEPDLAKRLSLDSAIPLPIARHGEAMAGVSPKVLRIGTSKRSFYQRFIKKKPSASRVAPPFEGEPAPVATESKAQQSLRLSTQMMEKDITILQSYARCNIDTQPFVSTMLRTLSRFLLEPGGVKDVDSYIPYLAGVMGREVTLRVKEGAIAGIPGTATPTVEEEVVAIDPGEEEGSRRGSQGGDEDFPGMSHGGSVGSNLDLRGTDEGASLVLKTDAADDAELMSPTAAEASEKPPAMDIIQEFQKNFAQFKEEMFTRQLTLMKGLSLGQQPKVMVVGCCDSRTSATMLMKAAPGQLFTVRNVANLVPTYERGGNFHGTSAALEYAVKHLKVEHIIVMGHRSCGGIRALMSRDPEQPVTSDFIDNWVEIAWPARQQTKAVCGDLPFDKQCRYCEKESINVSLGNLLTFPFIKQAVNANSLFLHGMYYDLAEGTLHRWRLVYKITDYEKWT
eukprot:jgi/Mesvir1/6402/Mv19497-RA.1